MHREKRRRPPGALTSPASVSAHGWRSVERLRQSSAPPALLLSSSYLPASSVYRQPAAHRPAAARSPVFSPPSSGVVLPASARISKGPDSEFGRVCFGGEINFSSLRALFSNCPSRHMEKMARPLPINPTFLPPTHGVLKSLLENPLKLPFHHDEGTFIKLDFNVQWHWLVFTSSPFRWLFPFSRHRCFWQITRS